MSSSEYAYWIYVVIYCKKISKWTAEIHFSDTTIDKLNRVPCYLQANRWWKEDRHCLLLLLLISSKKDCQFSGWLKTSNTALEFVPHYYLVEYQNKCCLTLKVQKWFWGTTLQGLQIIKTACYPVCYLVYSWRLFPPSQWCITFLLSVTKWSIYLHAWFEAAAILVGNIQGKQL